MVCVDVSEGAHRPKTNDRNFTPKLLKLSKVGMITYWPYEPISVTKV